MHYIYICITGNNRTKTNTSTKNHVQKPLHLPPNTQSGGYETFWLGSRSKLYQVFGGTYDFGPRTFIHLGWANLILVPVRTQPYPGTERVLSRIWENMFGSGSVTRNVDTSLSILSLLTFSNFFTLNPSPIKPANQLSAKVNDRAFSLESDDQPPASLKRGTTEFSL